MASLNAGRMLWRTLVHRSAESKTFFLAFTGVCIALPWAVAEGFMWASSYNQEKLQKKLREKPSGDLATVAAINNERLQELLDDVRLKRGIDDRYAAALRGEIMTGPPEARKIQKRGTSMPVEAPKAEPQKAQIKA